MSIRVGLIGFGLSGRVFHAPFVVNDPGMTMAYVCSSKVDEVRAVLPDVSVVSSAESVFAASDVDLVVITTPNALHFDQAKQALENGKHVLLEKPSVTSLTQIEALCTLAKQKGLVFCVYQNRRFDGDFLRLKALVESGELGELKHLDSRFDRFRPTAQARWREEPGVGTGIFWDLGPHILDQALCLFGPPKWLHASIDKLRDGSQTHDWFEMELGYDDKRIRLASTPFEAGDMRRFNARFTQGSWQCVGLDPQEEALRAGQMPWQEGFPSQAVQQRNTRFVAHTQDNIEAIQEASTQGEYAAFYGQLRDAILGKSEAPVPMEQACQLIYLLCLAEQSAESGQRMSWSYSPPLSLSK
ncbi:Gfo/Idh/MocA family oxidoreductase [Marinomonas sp. M1K-6]|uniref:Gfo/Idh/MocA family oxidoreductase n=1 Tax=Marinomonas profundi TaxID=2726122 RepID=A0A847R8C4_9GAMM|nr:Gfo/Idh/MocA family oxidoreductase [Marinomonas profundi]NLQ17184.1 Gfo/Idh/MocA family oxidoreductase [Marinomonas profundi]UDV04623.1 Gfo/Idh/MocA family oxidoreductase [Marinomonas profundi]